MGHFDRHITVTKGLPPTMKKVKGPLRKRKGFGRGIAAPQIGVPLRIFVVAGHVFALGKEEDEKRLRDKKIYPDAVFINPKVTKLSKKARWIIEGCLSARWLYGNVRRADKATVKAYDERGRKFSYGGSGLIAQIFQHEVDHLDGVLFLDKAKDVKSIPPEKRGGKK